VEYISLPSHNLTLGWFWLIPADPGWFRLIQADWGWLRLTCPDPTTDLAGITGAFALT
jgi:hypothetical protein